MWDEASQQYPYRYSGNISSELQLLCRGGYVDNVIYRDAMVPVEDSKCYILNIHVIVL